MKVPVKQFHYKPENGWEDNYQRLLEHHVEETAWMIAEIKRLEELLKEKNDTRV